MTTRQKHFVHSEEVYTGNCDVPKRIYEDGITKVLEFCGIDMKKAEKDNVCTEHWDLSCLQIGEGYILVNGKKVRVSKQKRERETGFGYVLNRTYTIYE